MKMNPYNEHCTSLIVSQQHLRQIVFSQGNLNWKDASENLRQIIVMKPLSYKKNSRVFHNCNKKLTFLMDIGSHQGYLLHPTYK